MAESTTLPPLRGRVQQDAPLAAITWFRVGGPADWLVRPADVDDLLLLLRDKPRDMPLITIGAASNLLVRDGGVRGIVLKLARGFSDIAVEADGIVAGAAALDATVAEHAAEAGLDGLAFLSGIPGSIGGAVAMNAGAYGAEVKDVLDWAEVATPTGLLRLSAGELGFAYRYAALPEGGVVVRARFHAKPGDKDSIAEQMRAIRTAREETQPVRARTGGSTFKNPAGRKAWALIDAAGCRGLKRGGAQISEKHCNFLLNLGEATAAELEGLGEEVRGKVRDMSGITLDWEIKRIGEALS
ncbi:UDP-N-acetylmuramate dehydrogenase [Pseudoroseomonas ludipueritiae]|uniref:UDP-N-acetylenolpyruvoylglucosamine reductase n=1 Tax=Pseudoroseomonas ludipueritiae TaxID=198093 RepID=A0ABR7RE22_9PROT|nr:UDP-N-acetylmuramate dehydrogenase [Pseudoroseomonas ludipueritiae]MBC9179685.1 UDP-N-acetylmuramate dehydrogenase [Pseudoroseomonas ludipueritiae]